MLPKQPEPNSSFNNNCGSFYFDYLQMHIDICRSNLLPVLRFTLKLFY